MRSRLRTTAFALAAAFAAGACSSYDDGYGGFGHVSVGYGNAYYDPYYDPWYDPYWSHYSAQPYWGWYGDFYYPGTGFFVYDRWRRPHRWDDRQRRFWVDRRNHWDRRGHWDGRREWRSNWRDFDRDRRDFRRDRRDDGRDFRRDRRDDRRDWARERRNRM